MGWWHFRTSFTLMQWGAYGAIAGFLVALVALALGGARARAAAAMVLAAGAFAGPFAFQRKARAVPAIHDISTDTDDPPAFVAVARAPCRHQRLEPS